MNYSKRIREIDTEIDNLENNLKEIEEVLKLKKSSNFKYGMIRNYGFYKMMTDEQMIGYLIQDFGRREEYKNMNDSSKLETMKDEIHKKITNLRTEQVILLRDRNSAQTKAVLVVEGDKIYIKGDPNKTDILAEIKKERQKLHDEIEGYKKDAEFVEFVKVKDDLMKAFDETNFPKYDIYDPDSVINLMVSPLVFYDDPYKEVLGYVVPTFDYRHSMPDAAVKYKEEAQNKLNNIEAEIGPFKPTFWARFSPKLRKKQEEEYKKKYDFTYEFYKGEYDKAVKAIELYPEFNKRFNEPYFEKIKPLLDKYEQMLDKNYYLEQKLKNYNKSVTQYKNCKYNEGQIYYVTGLLPDEAVDYLEENNLSITSEEILKNIDSITDEEIKREVKNKFMPDKENGMEK